jgi:hypothetical protein
MTTSDNPEIQNAPRGNSRAAQNRAIRRDALREELKAREYIRQVTEIAQRLNPEDEKAYASDQVPAVKARADIYFRLLDKCLPNLRPVDMPITLPFLGGTLTEDGRAVLTAIGQGDLSPQEAVSLLSALTAQARILEVDELENRIAALESQKGGGR